MSTLPCPFHGASAALLRRIAVCGALLTGCAAGFAQTGLTPASPAAPSPAASADNVPGRLRPTPRLTAPSDAQRSLNLDNLQPEGHVTPQIRIPLGKRNDAPILQRRPTETGSSTPPSATGSIGDAAAQCDAQRGAQARAKCHDASAKPAAR